MGMKEQRAKAGITHKKLSELTGISFQMLSAYENGSKDINGARLLTLLKICDGLNCNLEDIITDFETLAYLRNLGRRKKIKYNLYKNEETFDYKNRHKIEPGCTIATVGEYMDLPRLIKSFDNKAEALNELKNYKTTIQETSHNFTLYDVTEYYVEEAEYDEHGEWCGGGDIWAFSKFDERAINLIKNF